MQAGLLFRWGADNDFIHQNLTSYSYLSFQLWTNNGLSLKEGKNEADHARLDWSCSIGRGQVKFKSLFLKLSENFLWTLSNICSSTSVLAEELRVLSAKLEARTGQQEEAAKKLRNEPGQI